MFLLGLSVLTVGLVIGIAIGFDSLESHPDGLEGTWVLRYYGEPGKLRVPYPRYPWSDITLIISACEVSTPSSPIKVYGDYPDYPVRDYDYVITTYAGVNRCDGNCEVYGNKFITYYVMGGEKRTGGIVCTEMGGPAHLIAQEQHYLHILRSAQTYEITNGRLVISSGKEVLGFTRKVITL
jgi:hypothetical protein